MRIQNISRQVYHRVLNPEFSLHLARTAVGTPRFPNSFISVGINLEFEVTKTQRSESFVQLMKELESTNRHGFFFGIGPSSAFTMTNSPRITENLPFFGSASHAQGVS